jgi:hypothetical protein
MTVGDTFFNFYEKYIKPTPSKETEMVAPKGWSYGEIYKPTDDEKLTPTKRREYAHMCPLFMKGVHKKAHDSVRAWFSLETETDTAPLKIDIAALAAFEKRSQYKMKVSQAIIDSHIYGDGFLLIQFDESDKGVSLKLPPPAGSEPINVILLCPEFITSIDYISDANKKMDLFHYVYNDGTGNKFLIHPDRIQHFKMDPTSNSKFGLSKVDLLRNTIKSAEHVDVAVGRVLAWNSHGLLDIKAHDISDDDKKTLLATAKTHPSAWMHDPEDFEIEVIQPQAIDPKAFMDHLILNIASALVMPVHVLTGIQVGRVTGAEIGFADYYRDIKDLQELSLTPSIESLYQRIIEARGRAWKYNIVWDIVYVDEMAEAAIMEKRATFVVAAVNAGVISIEEGRRMMNEGMVELNPTIIPEPREPQGPNEPNGPKRPKPKNINPDDDEDN